MVTNPGTRDWSVTASLFATLNDMFGNRTVCGIGRGDSARRVIGQRPPTWRRLRDSMHVIKDLAEGKRSSTTAHRCSIPWVATARLEIWMAAYGPKALKLVGEQADGFILQTGRPRDRPVDDRLRARRRRRTPAAIPSAHHDVRRRAGLRR